jgi:phosphomannomutase/phosphoglucomutase
VTIFKACDVRGTYGKDLTEDTAFRIGGAIARYIASRNDVIVGGDVRLSTPNLKTCLVRGLLARGCTVIDIGTVPTPVFYFAKKRIGVYAGVMITASHNPPEFNGFKFMFGDMPVMPDELRRIEELAASENTNNISYKPGIPVQKDLIPDYNAWLLSCGFTAQRHLRPVIDCGNGCYSRIAPEMFQKLGYDSVRLFCEPDGSFPNRHPNSAIKENLIWLSKKVIEHGAEIGVAFDGDGDRVSFVDETGSFISPDRMIVLIMRMLLTQKVNVCSWNGTNAGDSSGQPKIVYDIKCSSIVPEEVARMNGIPLVEKSGHTFIKTRMIRENAVFGAEISGHFFYRSLCGGDDGLFTALLVCRELSSRRVRMSELVAGIPQYITTPDIRVRYESTDKANLLEEIAKAHQENREVLRIDGVRVEFANGWGLARISVTEPVLTFRFEGTDREALRDVIKRFLAPARSDLRNLVVKEVSSKIDFEV